MILIAGAGVAGSYLTARLNQSGFEVSTYDPKRPDFRIPCGYATNLNLLRTYCSRIGIEAEKYVERMAEDIIMAGNGISELHFRSAGLCTIDKMALERDMIGNSQVVMERAPQPGENDILIDATGISRLYLGRSPADFTMHAIEYLTESAEHNDFYFRYFSRGHGYYWEFPLKNGYHIGAGSDHISLIKSELSRSRPRLVMARDIRIRPLFDQISRERTIGVGEAIGTVSPITGEGIVPSLKSAEILYNCLKGQSDIQEIAIRYMDDLKREFSPYMKLYSLLEDARQGKMARPRNIWAASAVKSDLRGFGIDVRIGEIITEIFTSKFSGS